MNQSSVSALESQYSSRLSSALLYSIAYSSRLNRYDRACELPTITVVDVAHIAVHLGLDNNDLLPSISIAGLFCCSSLARGAHRCTVIGLNSGEESLGSGPSSSHLRAWWRRKRGRRGKRGRRRKGGKEEEKGEEEKREKGGEEVERRRKGRKDEKRGKGGGRAEKDGEKAGQEKRRKSRGEKRSRRRCADRLRNGNNEL